MSGTKDSQVAEGFTQEIKISTRTLKITDKGTLVLCVRTNEPFNLDFHRYSLLQSLASSIPYMGNQIFG